MKKKHRLDDKEIIETKIMIFILVLIVIFGFKMTATAYEVCSVFNTENANAATIEDNAEKDGLEERTKKVLIMAERTQLKIGLNSVSLDHAIGNYEYKAEKSGDYRIELSNLDIDSNSEIQQSSIYCYRLNKNIQTATDIEYDGQNYKKIVLISDKGKQMYSSIANDLDEYTQKMMDRGHDILFTDQLDFNITLNKGESLLIKQIGINNKSGLDVDITLLSNKK